ncbi:TerB family tellurite resistance protein [Vibrio chagasii]|nr:TerB family tellurite resistance protein [Vibrio chagasii]
MREALSTDHEDQRIRTRSEVELTATSAGHYGRRVESLVANKLSRKLNNLFLCMISPPNGELSQTVRIDLIKAMWEVAHADGEIDPLEDSVIVKNR